ncbi:MAG: GTPase Era [Polyangiaceae bacterium]
MNERASKPGPRSVRGPKDRKAAPARPGKKGGPASAGKKPRPGASATAGKKPRPGGPAGAGEKSRPGQPARSGKDVARSAQGPAGRAATRGTQDRAAKAAPQDPKTRSARTPPPVKAAPAVKRKPAPQGKPRSGAVAIVGRANVGKSTLLNAALGQPLAIVSPTPQTTRDTLLGVLHHGAAELRLLDTPGLHKPKTELGRVMNHHAREAARAADVVVFVVAVPQRGHGDHTPITPHPGDLTLLQSLKEGAGEGEGQRPVILVLNKVDLVRDKGLLLPLIEAFSAVLSFSAIVPISARAEGEAGRVIDEVARLLPEGAWQFGADDLTDRPTRYFAAEYVREQILRATRLEVPHAAAVTVDGFSEPERGAVEIDITIHVERPGQKKILVGKGGATLKQIGMAARLRVEEMLGRRVILRTYVRVTEAWRASAQRLAEMGYQRDEGESGVLVFAELPEDVDPASALGGEAAEYEESAPTVIVGDDEEQDQ